jgi:hypothetical protein
MKHLPAAVALAVFTAACNSAAPRPGSAARTDTPTAPGVAVGAVDADWPDEPSGFVPVTDRVWDALTGGGWNRRPGANDRIVADATAPRVATVLEYVYPAGFAGGTAPATHYFPLNGRREIFVGMLWRPSSPWQGHASLINKIQFLYVGASDVPMVMYGPPDGPYELRVIPQWPEHDGSWLRPTAARTSPALGQWHRLEWYLRYESSPGTADGVIRWWIDGALVGDYTTLRFPHDAGFVEYQISPTWGGVGDVKRETDSFRFARSYISARP